VIEPSNLELERQQAYVALDLQEWKQADELTDDVIARSPDDEATLRLARMRDVHKMSEVRISGTQGISSDSPVSGKNDFNINTAIYSPPINDNWRLFTGFNFATGEFEEGKGLAAIWRLVRNGLPVITGPKWKCLAETMAMGRK
jgi:biofilm PGA synthesis protein PgaA